MTVLRMIQLQEYANDDVEKPCWKLGYCPFGVLIYDFSAKVAKNDPRRCSVYGYICPSFFYSQCVVDDADTEGLELVAGKAFTFDDIVADAVKKELMKDKDR